MQTALRKMGNSTGMIVPKPILKALGVATGASMDIVVEEGRIIATPVKRVVREGWEEAAKLIGAERDPEADEWLAFANDGDDLLEW